MNDNTNPKKENKKKGLFARVAEKIDKKMEEKAKSAKCCCSAQKQEDNSCCS